ncbi:MAG: hypothetical protein AB8I08_04720 [Sandaracinaceae bacterium]
MSKVNLVERVCDLVRQVTEARFTGGPYAKLARAHGYADGYMRALLDAGLVDREELLSAVAEARRNVTDPDAKSGRRSVAA